MYNKYLPVVGSNRELTGQANFRQQIAFSADFLAFTLPRTQPHLWVLRMRSGVCKRGSG